jgi:hypothetical protein
VRPLPRAASPTVAPVPSADKISPSTPSSLDTRGISLVIRGSQEACLYVEDPLRSPTDLYDTSSRRFYLHNYFLFGPKISVAKNMDVMFVVFRYDRQTTFEIDYYNFSTRILSKMRISLSPKK